MATESLKKASERGMRGFRCAVIEHDSQTREVVLSWRDGLSAASDHTTDAFPLVLIRSTSVAVRRRL